MTIEPKERNFTAALLFLIWVLVTYDLLTDSSQGVKAWHLAVESAIGLMAAAGIFFLMRHSFRLRKSLVTERTRSSQLQLESERWRTQASKYVLGLSQAIDHQLTLWQLTSSEKEVAFLLLKGLSSKEIAEVRRTSEKTARTQATSIYEKAGLVGRSELSAFFLEDLLSPAPEPSEH